MWKFGRPQQVVAWIRVVLGEMVRSSENVRNIFGNRIDRPWWGEGGWKERKEGIKPTPYVFVPGNMVRDDALHWIWKLLRMSRFSQEARSTFHTWREAWTRPGVKAGSRTLRKYWAGRLGVTEAEKVKVIYWGLYYRRPWMSWGREEKRYQTREPQIMQKNKKIFLEENWKSLTHGLSRCFSKPRNWRDPTEQLESHTGQLQQVPRNHQELPKPCQNP